jgi:hypothetical protein
MLCVIILMNNRKPEQFQFTYTQQHRKRARLLRLTSERGKTKCPSIFSDAQPDRFGENKKTKFGCDSNVYVCAHGMS